MSRRLMLDTDIFSYVVNDRYAGLRERFMRDVETICISSVTYAEALYGARKKKSERIASLIGLFSDFIAILPWTERRPPLMRTSGLRLRLRAPRLVPMTCSLLP